MRMPMWGAAGVIGRLELMAKPRWVVWGVILPSVLVAIDVGVYFTGGTGSPLLLLLLACILSAGLIFAPPVNYFIATFANLSLVATAFLESQVRVPNDQIRQGTQHLITRFSSHELAMLVAFVSISYAGLFAFTQVAQRVKRGQTEISLMLREQERIVTHLAVLQQIGTEISAITDLDAVLDLIVRKAKGLFSADIAFLALQEKSSEDFRITVTAGDKTDALREVKLKPGQGMEGLVMASGEPIIVEDYGTDPRLVGRPLYAAREVELKSGMAAPLSVGQRRIGVLYVFNRQTTVFDASDAEMLLALANQAAIAIENARLYSDLRDASLSDNLTGLHNSRYLRERLNSEISRVTRYGGKLALIMADCDSLKEINDRFGHEAGDLLLSRLGRLLRDNLRESDVVTRYGGDEFVILLPEADVFAAQQAAERLRGKVAYTQMDAGGIQLIITISMGIATFPDDASSAEEMLRRADNALARAKSLGKNRVCVVEPVI